MLKSAFKVASFQSEMPKWEVYLKLGFYSSNNNSHKKKTIIKKVF